MPFISPPLELVQFVLFDVQYSTRGAGQNGSQLSPQLPLAPSFAKSTLLTSRNPLPPLLLCPKFY